MTNEIAKILDNLGETIDWAGSFHDYLKGTVSELKELADNLPDKEHYDNASKKLRDAERSGKKMFSFYNNVKKKISSIKNSVSSEDKKRLELIEKEFGPNEAILIAKTSFFKGTLNDDFEKIGANVDLLKKDQSKIGDVKNKIFWLIKKIEEDIIADPEFVSGKPGLLPFIVCLRKLRTIFERLNK